MESLDINQQQSEKCENRNGQPFQRIIGRKKKLSFSSTSSENSDEDSPIENDAKPLAYKNLLREKESPQSAEESFSNHGEEEEESQHPQLISKNKGQDYWEEEPIEDKENTNYINKISQSNNTPKETTSYCDDLFSEKLNIASLFSENKNASKNTMDSVFSFEPSQRPESQSDIQKEEFVYPKSKYQGTEFNREESKNISEVKKNNYMFSSHRESEQSDDDRELSDKLSENDNSKSHSSPSSNSNQKGVDSLNKIFEKQDLKIDELLKKQNHKDEEFDDISSSSSSSSDFKSDVQQISEKLAQKHLRNIQKEDSDNEESKYDKDLNTRSQEIDRNYYTEPLNSNRSENPKRGRFDMNVPVHHKIMELYFKEDECIEEASCEHSLMSTSRKEYFNSTAEGAIKDLTHLIENEVPLDLSRISNMQSFDANIANEEYNEDRINSIKKEIFDIEKNKDKSSTDEKDKKLSQFIFDSFDKQNSGTSSGLKNQNRSDDMNPPSNKKINKFNLDNSDEEDEDFYQNEFELSHKNPPKNNLKETEIKDPMLVLFGDSKLTNSKQPISKKPEIIRTASFQDSCNKLNIIDYDSAKLKICKLFNKFNQSKLRRCITKWRMEIVASKFTFKIQSAAAMVDKMSKFSRTFISVNTMHSVIQK